MPPTRRRLLAAAATMTVAGCLTDDDPGQPDPTATDTATPPESQDGTGTPTDAPATTTVDVRNHDEYGDILVGPDGLTLYMFDQDTQGADQSTCSGGCADTWPPLTAADGVGAGADVTAELGAFEREGGDSQVTADGWPLYYYATDQAPGDATGQGVGGVWWVLAPDGTPRRPSSTPTPTETDATGGSSGGGSDGDRGYDY